MRSKLFFAAIAAFWVVMNILLWRSQSAAHSEIGSAIPVEIVWDKILTAPDNSSLEIYDHTNKIGFCHWMATVGGASQALNQSLADDYAPEGLMPQPTGYGLTVEGNTTIFGTNRVRFEMHLRLATNEIWQDFRLTAKMRPTSWDIHAIAAAQKIMVKINGDDGNWQRTLRFSEFEHPETLLAEFGMGDFLGLAGAANLLSPKGGAGQLAAGLHWQAHEDWIQFGHSKVRAYRVETEFFGQHLYIFTSRAGEILWVEAPNKLTFRNEAFSHF
jgi:hypothetical protein